MAIKSHGVTKQITKDNKIQVCNYIKLLCFIHWHWGQETLKITDLKKNFLDNITTILQSYDIRYILVTHNPQ